MINSLLSCHDSPLVFDIVISECDVSDINMYFSDNFISVLIIVEFNILSDIFSDRIISEVSWVISSVDLSVSTFSEYVFSMNGPFVISDSVRNLFEYVFSELFSFVVSVSVSEIIVWDMS